MNVDERREYRAIEVEAEAAESEARVMMKEGDPRRGQVHATLAVSARLEALSYAIRHVVTVT